MGRVLTLSLLEDEMGVGVDWLKEGQHRGLELQTGPKARALSQAQRSWCTHTTH